MEIIRKPMNKKEVIAEYTDWVEGMRQKERIKNDLEELKKLPDDNYYVFYRQYAGHSYTPKKVNNLLTIQWISSAVSWPRNIGRNKPYGDCFVVTHTLG